MMLIRVRVKIVSGVVSVGGLVVFVGVLVGVVVGFGVGVGVGCAARNVLYRCMRG